MKDYTILAWIVKVLTIIIIIIIINPDSYPMGTGGSLPGGKAAEA
jgi:hypothetical protein